MQIDLKTEAEIKALTHEELLRYVRALDAACSSIHAVGSHCVEVLKKRMESLQNEIKRAEQDAIDGYYNYANFIQTQIH